MSLSIVSRIAVVAALALLASSASAQSLADVARQEEARRAAVKAAARAKVLTNADLAADPRAAALSAESTAPDPPGAAPSASASANPGNVDAGAVVAAAPPDAKPKEDEASWRSRAADLRARVEKAQKATDVFANGTPAKDPREQARVDALRKKAQDTLTRAEDALRLLIMQADVAGVPSAWVQ